MCDLTHSHVTWLIQMCGMACPHVRHVSFTCATWVILVCAMTRPHVRHDALARVPWLTHMCDQNDSHVWYDAFIRMTRSIHKCDMSHWYERTRLIAIHSSTTLHPLISMCHITHSYMQHDSFIRRHDSLEYAAAQLSCRILWGTFFGSKMWRAHVARTLCAPHFARTHSRVSHKSLACATWLVDTETWLTGIRSCSTTTPHFVGARLLLPLYARHILLPLIYECRIKQSHMTATWLIHKEISLIHIWLLRGSDITLIHVTSNDLIRAT